MGLVRQEHWSGLLVTPLGDLSDPGIKSMSPAAPALQGIFFATEPSGKPFFTVYQVSNSVILQVLQNWILIPNYKVSYYHFTDGTLRYSS